MKPTLAACVILVAALPVIAQPPGLPNTIHATISINPTLTSKPETGTALNGRVLTLTHNGNGVYVGSDGTVFLIVKRYIGSLDAAGLPVYSKSWQIGTLVETRANAGTRGLAIYMYGNALCHEQPAAGPFPTTAIGYANNQTDVGYNITIAP